MAARGPGRRVRGLRGAPEPGRQVRGGRGGAGRRAGAGPLGSSPARRAPGHTLRDVAAPREPAGAGPRLPGTPRLRGWEGSQGRARSARRLRRGRCAAGRAGGFRCPRARTASGPRWPARPAHAPGRREAPAGTGPPQEARGCGAAGRARGCGAGPGASGAPGGGPGVLSAGGPFCCAAGPQACWSSQTRRGLTVSPRSLRGLHRIPSVFKMRTTRCFRT